MSGELERRGGYDPAMARAETRREMTVTSSGGYRRDYGAGPSHGPSGLPRPDWLMFGVPRHDQLGRSCGFRLYACKDVTRADLAVISEVAMPAGQIDVAARLGATLIIDGASYGECLARMAEIWRNWDTDGR